MLQSNHSLARPCPSCGAPLRVHSGRLTQKMQCPKCLDTIVLDPAVALETPPERRSGGKRASRKKPKTANQEAGAPVQSGTDLSRRYAELQLEHAQLAERYAEVVGDYDALVTAHGDLARRLHRLGEQMR